MSVTHIYIIRHGQSEGNQNNVFLGHTDLDLTELGHKQAELTAKYLEDVHIDAIYSSDLRRAYNTGKYTAKKKGIEIITDKALREIYAGEWENQYILKIAEKYTDDFMNVWKNDIGHARCTGGESVEELQRRFVTRVKELAKENEGKTICIFTHATPIRSIKAAFDGLSLDEMKNVPWASNASVTHAVCENGVFSIVTYGENSFLTGINTELPKSV